MQLEFQPKKDITAWELCRVTQLIGYIRPGVRVLADRLEGAGTLIRHFVCPYADRPNRDIDDCEGCGYCLWPGQVDEWKELQLMQQEVTT